MFSSVHLLMRPAQNFASMQLAEVDQNITVRRNRIFLLMEEVRRLRIQRRLKVSPLAVHHSQHPLPPLQPTGL